MNDIENRKINELKKIIHEIEPNPPYNITCESKDFKVLFDELYVDIKRNKGVPRLMFIDQFGIKYVTKELFLRLTELKRTDLLFFISSSFVRRFNENDEFRKYLEIKRGNFLESHPLHSHRVICDYYKSLLTDNNK